jgi:dCMP deaminase
MKSFYQKGMERAFFMAQSSHDPDTQTGCAVFDADGVFLGGGCNRIPFPIPVTKERTTRPEKYNWIEHAERHAIYNAGNVNRFEGATMFLNWFPCADCARAIVGVRIRELVYIIKEDRKTDPRYGFETSVAILKAGEVRLTEYTPDL